MNIQDAANLLDISGEVTPEIAKLAYRRAAMKYHPDRNPAGLTMMQAINAAYKLLSDYTGTVETSNGYGDLLNDAINAIITCPNLIIEVCGNWIWVSGETKASKDILYNAGYIYASVKKMWYFRPEEWKSSNRKKNTIDDIRNVYGSEKIETKQTKSLT